MAASLALTSGLLSGGTKYGSSTDATEEDPGCTDAEEGRKGTDGRELLGCARGEGRAVDERGMSVREPVAAVG